MESETIALFYASALPWLDTAGIAVFAASGALAAARSRQDIVTFCFFAAVTGTGGGTVRDLLIGAPVFWMHNPRPLAICLVMAVLVWATPARWWAERSLEWLDAAGLAAYAVYGSAKALAWGIGPLPAIGMGIITASLGGIIRDVLAGVPSILLKREIYVTAAGCAAMIYVGLQSIGMEPVVAAIVASAAGFVLRGLALWRDLRLPAYERE